MALELGTRARRAAKATVSEGQPQAASLEPSPLEVAEQERGERDDAIRESMAAQAIIGRAEGIPLPTGESELSALGDATLKLYRFLSGQYNHERLIAGKAANETAEQEVARMKVKAGMLYTIRRAMTLAPAGSKMRFYRNNVSPTNQVEVITAAQEFTGELPGLLRLRGNEELVVTILGAKEAGSVVVHLEGDLVYQEPVPW